MTEKLRAVPAAPGPEEIAAHAVAGASDIHVVLGPMCWQPSDGTASKVW
jgi:hypothetical protein